VHNKSYPNFIDDFRKLGGIVKLLNLLSYETFGIVFRVSLFGESHGPAIGVTLTDAHRGIPLKTEDLTSDLARRKSGRKELRPGKKEIFLRSLPVLKTDILLELHNHNYPQYGNGSICL